MRYSLALIVTGLSGAAQMVDALQVRQIYQFEEATFIENISVRPNGHLLIDTFHNATMYTIDPKAEKPVADIAAQLPGADSLTGITEVSPDVFAFTGGIGDIANYAFVAGTAEVGVADFRGCGDGPAKVKQVAKGGNTAMLNGLAALPWKPHIVLSAGSKEGNIFRTNTVTGDFDIAFQDDKLAPGPNPVVPLGVNGIKIQGGYLYFTNSAKRFFGRVKINHNGDRVGTIEEIAHLPSNVSNSTAYDDFSLDHEGNAYVGTHPNMLTKIAPDGKQTVLVDGNSSVVLDGPTATALSKDGKTVYIVTGGVSSGKGQVVAVTL